MAAIPIAVGEGQGEALWFNRDLLVFKATSAQTDGALILIEQTSQRGKTTPQHRHKEDETFYVRRGCADRARAERARWWSTSTGPTTLPDAGA